MVNTLPVLATGWNSLIAVLEEIHWELEILQSSFTVFQIPKWLKYNCILKNVTLFGGGGGGGGGPGGGGAGGAGGDLSIYEEMGHKENE